MVEMTKSRSSALKNGRKETPTTKVLYHENEFTTVFELSEVFTQTESKTGLISTRSVAHLVLFHHEKVGRN